jgi:hypothetical protein
MNAGAGFRGRRVPPDIDRLAMDRRYAIAHSAKPFGDA